MKKLLLISAALFSIGSANAGNNDILAKYKAQDITVLFEAADINKDNMLSIKEVKDSAKIIIRLADELDDVYEDKNDKDRKKDGFWDIL